VNTSEDDHGKGAYLMLTGRRQTPAADYPRIGAVAAKALAPEDSPLPGHIVITPGGGGGSGNDSAYLEPKYASVVLGNGNPPQYTARPEGLGEQTDASRNEFRRRANERFLSRRRTAMTDAYAASYEQALQLMAQREVFDVAKEPAKDQERYGKYDFGRHCLLARRLLEKGITFVQISHSNYDTHNENFDFHLEQLGEFDLGFSNFVSDIADRGMLESTLIVVLSEFGRTPNINLYYGRDHWSKAWTVVMGGCRTPRGIAYGSTNADGTEVVDGQVDHGNLFHTYLQSVGVDPAGAFNIEGREMPIADPASHAVEDLLA
jgi:arylsulfatase A-like enzyme